MAEIYDILSLVLDVLRGVVQGLNSVAMALWQQASALLYAVLGESVHAQIKSIALLLPPWAWLILGLLGLWLLGRFLLRAVFGGKTTRHLHTQDSERVASIASVPSLEQVKVKAPQSAESMVAAASNDADELQRAQKTFDEALIPLPPDSHKIPSGFRRKAMAASTVAPVTASTPSKPPASTLQTPSSTQVKTPNASTVEQWFQPTASMVHTPSTQVPSVPKLPVAQWFNPELRPSAQNVKTELATPLSDKSVSAVTQMAKSPSTQNVADWFRTQPVIPQSKSVESSISVSQDTVSDTAINTRINPQPAPSKPLSQPRTQSRGPLEVEASSAATIPKTALSSEQRPLPANMPSIARQTSVIPPPKEAVPLTSVVSPLPSSTPSVAVQHMPDVTPINANEAVSVTVTAMDVKQSSAAIVSSGVNEKTIEEPKVTGSVRPVAPSPVTQKNEAITVPIVHTLPQDKIRPVVPTRIAPSDSVIPEPSVQQLLATPLNHVPSDGKSKLNQPLRNVEETAASQETVIRSPSVADSTARTPQVVVVTPQKPVEMTSATIASQPNEVSEQSLQAKPVEQLVQVDENVDVVEDAHTPPTSQGTETLPLSPVDNTARTPQVVVVTPQKSVEVTPAIKELKINGASDPKLVQALRGLTAESLVLGGASATPLARTDSLPLVSEAPSQASISEAQPREFAKEQASSLVASSLELNDRIRQYADKAREAQSQMSYGVLSDRARLQKWMTGLQADELLTHAQKSYDAGVEDVAQGIVNEVLLRGTAAQCTKALDMRIHWAQLAKARLQTELR